MTDLLMLIVIAVCLVCIIFTSWNPLKRVREVSDLRGSVWHHIQQRVFGGGERKDLALTEQISAPQRKPLVSENIPEIEMVAVEVQISQVPQHRKKKSKRESLSDVASDDEIQFLYPNHHGTGYVTRRITAWAVDADYMEGYCHARQGMRTFSLQRIRGKLTSLTTGEIQSVGKWASARHRRLRGRNVFDAAVHRPVEKKDSHIKNSRRAQLQATVFCVGFRDVKREELESMARAAGWKVRKEFSTSVDVLIAGPLVGHVQISKADSMGIDIISESDFKKELRNNYVRRISK